MWSIPTLTGRKMQNQNSFFVNSYPNSFHIACANLASNSTYIQISTSIFQICFYTSNVFLRNQCPVRILYFSALHRYSPRNNECVVFYLSFFKNTPKWIEVQLPKLQLRAKLRTLQSLELYERWQKEKLQTHLDRKMLNNQNNP